MTKNKEKGAVLIVKKYANRRLYDTQKSAYITLEDLCALVKQDVEFKVLDAKTDEDLTRSVLTQIIFEQESKGYSVLPINFLRQVIKFYDDSLPGIRKRCCITWRAWMFFRRSSSSRILVARIWNYLRKPSVCGQNSIL